MCDRERYGGVPARAACPVRDVWIAERYREFGERGIGSFDEVMDTAGRCLRVLPDRENWYLRPWACT